MNNGGIFSSCAKSLAKMMDADGGEGELWTPEELGAILDHQLSAPLAADLSIAGGKTGEQIETLAAAAVPPIRTFRDLFAHPRPPVELLELTKQFAKRCRSCSERPLPDAAATVLYFLCIVVAMMKCDSSISKLDDQALRLGLDWVLAQPWVDAESRRLFLAGSEFVRD